jgi:DNA-binding transcriptional regulator YdaS (Cro superfamily)
MKKTGWDPPALMQDDHGGLSRWFATRPDARYTFLNPRSKQMKQQENLIDVVQILGGSSIVGRALGVRPQAVSQWMHRQGRGIPIERVLDLIRLGKKQGVVITPQQVRPDLDWDALRKEMK